MFNAFTAIPFDTINDSERVFLQGLAGAPYTAPPGLTGLTPAQQALLSTGATVGRDTLLTAADPQAMDFGALLPNGEGYAAGEPARRFRSLFPDAMGDA